jgi:hypothetical protein
MKAIAEAERQVAVIRANTLRDTLKIEATAQVCVCVCGVCVVVVCVVTM